MAAFLHKHVQLTAIDADFAALPVRLLVNHSAITGGVLHDAENSVVLSAPALLGGDAASFQVLRNSRAALTSEKAAVDFPNHLSF